MNIHEYQAKALLAKYAIPLLKGGVAYTKDEAMDVARKLGTPVIVVKSQIHAGGRGKGRFKNDPEGKGGVRLAKSVDEVGTNAAAMLGQELVTKQTGPTGKTVKRLYIEQGCDIKRELYVSMLVDRVSGRVAVVAPVSCTTPTRVCVATTAATACERFVVPWYTGWWRRPRGWCLWRQPLFEHRHDEGPLLHQRLPLAEPGVVVVGGDAGRDGHLDLGDGREDTGVHRRQPQFQQAVVALAGETAGFVTASAAYTARAAERQRVQLLCRGQGRLADGMPYAAGRAAPHTTAHI